MGIIANAKQFLAKKAVSAVKETEDGIADLSALSPKQLQKVEEKRTAYLSGRPDMSGEEAQSIIQKHMGAIGIEVYQAYLEQLETIYQPVDVKLEDFDEDNRIRFFDITKWVTDSEEQSLDKLVNVYHVLSEEECNIALIYHRTKDACKISIGVVNTDERQSEPTVADKYYSRLIGAIQGNFPGADISGIDSRYKDFGIGIPDCLQNLEADNSEKSIAVVSNVASEKSEDFISQSMEKLLDGIVPENETEEYTMVLLAKPEKDQLESKNRLYELYTALAPYAGWQAGYTYTESDGISSSAILGAHIGLSAGVNLGVKYGVDLGMNASANFGVSFSRSSGVTVQIGKNESILQSYTNFGVKHTLDMIESQLKRIEESSALGMWEFASYIISDSPVIVNNVAHMYLALTQGEESYLTRAAVNFWDGNINADATKSILASVQKLQHPVFGLKSSLKDEWLMYPVLVTPATPLSGKELAKALNFPRKSVSGLPVLEVAPFGREPQKFSISGTKTAGIPIEDKDGTTIDIGNVVHMYKAEKQKVMLNVNSFPSHTFVTGSTGTGKSNTIYQILSSLLDLGKHVLVIEPAKGEYRNALGNRCKTYGTNPRLSKLLRINPFTFPTGEGVKKPIHVLEHIDRLIEILNACWPMYAAMPAVLKDAMEMAYINKGWDLYSSECYPLKFPIFADLLTTLPEVMDHSLYSKDTQSDYAGALVTRIKSLTNGINGLVLCTDEEMTDQELFDDNVIIDISRVGSSETKAMLMGILIMKLQEYHMSSSGVNEDLQHITVLEEAHNLLRRTSFNQGQESANLQGKSVEMLTNSIAEMRTYGEGFIITDQAPGLLDEAVIRNTNTKIILRLPDADDRELVGRSAALSDDQINELAKLPRGVAAVYQNDWVEAVLCQFEKFESNYTDEGILLDIPRGNRPNESYFQILFGIKENREVDLEDAEGILRWIDRLTYPSSTKTKLRKVLAGEKLSEQEMKSVAYNVFNGKGLARHLRDSIDSKEGIAETDLKIKTMYDIENTELIIRIRQLILQFIVDHIKSDMFESRYIDYAGRRKM